MPVLRRPKPQGDCDAMNQLPNDMREQLNFQASLLRMNGWLQGAIALVPASDENVAVEVEKLAARL
jgi:hypothetical protein